MNRDLSKLIGYGVDIIHKFAKHLNYVMRLFPVQFTNLILIGLVLFTFSCDHVSNPVNPARNNGTLPSTPPSFIDSSTNYKIYKLLLEDCCGHLCGNCPLAAIESDTIRTAFPNQIIVMQENMNTTFAAPGTCPLCPNGNFSADYRSAAGNEWDTYFGIDVPGLPEGMVDRVHYSAAGNSSVDIEWPNWRNIVDSLLQYNSIPKVTINILDSCWVSQRIIGVRIKVNVPFSLTGSYYLEPVIVEDSIIDWQEDYYPSPQCISNYVRRYTLRGAFNMNNWGDSIPTSVTSNAGTFTKYYIYNFTTGENGKAAGWNMKNCYIVAFVYNSIKYDVLQAEMIKVD